MRKILESTRCNIARAAAFLYDWPAGSARRLRRGNIVIEPTSSASTQDPARGGDFSGKSDSRQSVSGSRLINNTILRGGADIQSYGIDSNGNKITLTPDHFEHRLRHGPRVTSRFWTCTTTARWTGPI